MTSSAGWTRVVVVVADDHAELAADLLWRFEPAAVEERTHPRGTELLAGFATEAAATAAARALDDAGWGPADRRPVTDDGLDGWRAWAVPVHAPPFVLVPAWQEVPEAAAGEVVLRIDPGRTFGSGSHPTTRLVLSRAAALVRDGASVLDVGCGSGVLAVGAAVLGAEHVTAIDVDPLAGPATAGNAAVNGVADRVDASARPLADVVAEGRRFDVVLANLLAPVVVELADDLVAAVAPAGHLVVSGLLADRWREATAPLAPLVPVDVVELDGWVAVTLTAVPLPAA